MSRLTNVFVFGILLGFGSAAYADRPGNSDAPGNSLRVATYNLENLFDASHDEGKQDWFYLPIAHPGKPEGCAAASASHAAACAATDWTAEKAQMKIEQMKQALLAQGSLPDILGVQEVENAAILGEFARAVGYSNFLLEEGEDERGIDVGLLYQAGKVTYLEHAAHRLNIPTNKTRDILAVYFKLKNAKDANAVLAVYVNHWPSQGNPAADRVVAAKKLLEIIASDKARFGEANLNALAIGDFNTVDSDFPNPFMSELLNTANPHRLLDMRQLQKETAPDAARDIPLGTYFYPPKMAWQDLDHIFVSRNLTDGTGVEVRPRSFKIHNWPRLTSSVTYPTGVLQGSVVTGAPTRYDANATNPATAGFTDHFAISVDVVYP